MTQKFLLASLITCLTFGGNPVFSQETNASKDGAKEGSMEEVWSDHPSTQGGANAQAAATTSNNFSLNQFKSSEFVNLGSFPGLGPFEDTDNKDVLKDKFENKITIATTEDKITSAQLDLGKSEGKFEAKMRLQIALDYLLESLGAKSGDIAFINNSVERDFEKINQAQNQEEGLSVSAGPYHVALAKAVPDTNAAFTMTVTKAELPVNTVATAITVTTDNTNTSTDTTTTTNTDTNTIIRRPRNTPTINPADSKFSISTVPPNLNSTRTTPERTPPPAKSEDDVLRTQFENLVVGWQNIRRAVVKNRQTQNLTKILGGKALANQSQAIKWLLDNDMYYEFELRSLKMTGFKAIVPGSKYEVNISIQERQKKFSAKTMKMISDAEKDYKATYTVEKIRGAWLIMDSVAHSN